MSRPAPAAALLALFAGACAAPNPAGESRPLAPAPTATAESVPDADAAPPADAAEAASLPEAAEPAPAPAPQRIARVGGSSIDARHLFVRTWWRAPDLVREVLEQLVVERIAMLEAQRLGIAVEPDEVEERVDRAWAALAQRAAEEGTGLGPEDYVRQVIGLEPGFYQGQLRGDALVQVLLERSIRSWALERDRCVARVLALADRTALRSAQDLLAAGASFDEVARTWGLDTESEGGGRRIVIARDERIALSRVAFQTEVGEVGGPVEQEGAFLLLLVEERLGPWDGPEHRFQAAVARDLAERPVEDLEYVQWRAAMELRYAVDLSPFAALVETPGR